MKNISYTVIIFFIIILSVSFAFASIPEIVLEQRKSVVTIYVNDKDGRKVSNGTGFIIDSNGIIATNCHVVAELARNDGNALIVKTENGAFFVFRELVNFDIENDIAIFRINGKQLPKIKIDPNYKPRQGEDIIVVGSPLGLETTVSDGIISSIRGKDGIIQITAPISPGSSGSPVFNLNGDVIGVATFRIQGGENLNFAMPVKYVENLLRETKRTRKEKIATSDQSQETRNKSLQKNIKNKFVAYNNGTVLDKSTGLMWATKDNGNDIGWHKAKKYCDEYNGGGYTDWRIPTLKELASLYDENKEQRFGYHLTDLIKITHAHQWSADVNEFEAGCFYFLDGDTVWHLKSYKRLRVLPVRNVR